MGDVLGLLACVIYFGAAALCQIIPPRYFWIPIALGVVLFVAAGLLMEPVATFDYHLAVGASMMSTAPAFGLIAGGVVRRTIRPSLGEDRRAFWTDAVAASIVGVAFWLFFAGIFIPAFQY